MSYYSIPASVWYMFSTDNNKEWVPPLDDPAPPQISLHTHTFACSTIEHWKGKNKNKYKNTGKGKEWKISI